VRGATGFLTPGFFIAAILSNLPNTYAATHTAATTTTRLYWNLWG
jgi:hypothetical protein